METSGNPILDDKALTTIVVVKDADGIEYNYRQEVPEHWIVAGRDIVLHVKEDMVHSVLAVALSIEKENYVEKVIVLDEKSGLKYLDLNEVRILYPLYSFNPSLN